MFGYFKKNRKTIAAQLLILAAAFVLVFFVFGQQKTEPRISFSDPPDLISEVMTVSSGTDDTDGPGMGSGIGDSAEEEKEEQQEEQEETETAVDPEGQGGGLDGVTNSDNALNEEGNGNTGEPTIIPIVVDDEDPIIVTDLAKYINAANMLPHYVSWGGEVNAAHFHNDMERQWNKNDSVFNELFYKELIGKKILFSEIERIVSDQQWYQENRAYRPQIVAYTFSKLVFTAKELHKELNYRQIWDIQKVPVEFEHDIARISRIVFEKINDPNRSTSNVETYCKKQECWEIISKVPYQLSEELIDILVSPREKAAEEAAAKKEQKFDNEIFNEIGIFQKGADYWTSMIERGKVQFVLNSADILALTDAIKYCQMQYTQLTKRQIKAITVAVAKLKENGIE